MQAWWDRAATCRLCGDDLDPTDIIHFDDMPVAGAYVGDPASPAAGDPAAPLSVIRCPGCGLVQLREKLAPAFYRQYGFTGAIGSAYRNYLIDLAEQMAAGLPRGGRVLEIGCGDGTLLAALRERNFDVRGFEPADYPRSEALRTNLRVSSDYLSDETFAASGFPKNNCIVIRHVLEHIDDFVTLLNGVDSAAEPDAHLLVEVPDLAETITGGMYGNIYHPHSCYFDRVTLTALLRQHGWQVAEARVAPVFGGSLLVAAGRGTAVAAPLRLPMAYPEARATKAGDLEVFAQQWRLFSATLRAAVRGWRAQGLRVTGYGAAERTGSLVGTAGLDSTDLLCLYDKNPFFIGKALPKVRIPIRQPDQISVDRPDILVIFAQSHEAEILRELAVFRRTGMRFVGLRAAGPKELEAS